MSGARVAAPTTARYRSPHEAQRNAGRSPRIALRLSGLRIEAAHQLAPLGRHALRCRWSDRGISRNFALDAAGKGCHTGGNAGPTRGPNRDRCKWRQMAEGTSMNNKLVAAMAAAVIVAGGFALTGAAQAQQPIIIKFSHVVSPDAPKGKAAIVFKDLVEKYTNGRVKAEVYPNSSLYKDKEELEALQLGSVQLLAPSISKFGPLGVKEYDVFDLPFQ